MPNYAQNRTVKKSPIYWTETTAHNDYNDYRLSKILTTITTMGAHGVKIPRKSGEIIRKIIKKFQCFGKTGISAAAGTQI